MDQEIIARYMRASELTKQGMARQAALGKPQGPVPLGYRNCRSGGMKAVELADPETVRLIQETFALAADGLPLRKILAEMTERGLKSRHGKPLGPSALWGILTNPFYIGKICFNNTLIESQHKPLIDVETFNRSQVKFSHHRRNLGTKPINQVTNVT